ncbi:sigma factor [Streptomyces phage Lannister]|uniref:DNA binding protein n=1 Tax=Streptomyces phage Lannister TaxID=1674927 RepID=A0A0K1YA27_9CAUD|nr:sigma factor [Streptomyces phage Lannister]AKY03729.1 DNA binding protein [Streptomyces phage Lannister]
MGGYNRALVEKLLPAVWDGHAAYGLKNDQAADADMPKGQTDPKTANTLFAHLADIKAAWRWVERGNIPIEEARALLLRFGLDLTQEEAAGPLGTHQRQVSRLIERGVGRVTAYLNGVTYVDGYDNDNTEEVAA